MGYLERHKFTILSLLVLAAISLVLFDQARVSGAQHRTDRVVKAQAKLSAQNRKLIKANGDLTRSNTRNIRELKEQKANILTLKKTNCGVRLAMLKAADGARKVRGEAAAQGYIQIANLFPEINCHGIGLKIKESPGT